MKKGLLVVLFLFIISVCATSATNKFVVVIDAGHGGKDPGAVRNNYKEKHINLGVALALGKLIENNFKDVKVIYTRKTDVFVELTDRAAIANRNKANLFISIHTNSTDAKRTNASGADTYILGLTKSAENLAVAKRENSVVTLESDYKNKYEGFDPHSPESYIIFEFMSNKYMEQSLQFATEVQNQFKNIAKRNDRGVRQAGFLVLWRTAMPSVLIELGFINNSEEVEYLTSKSGQNALARSIYSGFKKYKQNYDKMQGNASASLVEDVFDLEEEEVDVPLMDTASTPNDSQTREIEERTVNNTRIKRPTNKEVSTTLAPNKSATTTNNAVKNTDRIEYRVQFLVATKRLPSNSPLFKGLSPTEFYMDGNTYKYTYGSAYELKEIEKIQQQVRLKFKDAFVVKFKNGKRIK